MCPSAEQNILHLRPGQRPSPQRRRTQLLPGVKTKNNYASVICIFKNLTIICLVLCAEILFRESSGTPGSRRCEDGRVEERKRWGA